MQTLETASPETVSRTAFPVNAMVLAAARKTGIMVRQTRQHLLVQEPATMAMIDSVNRGGAIREIQYKIQYKMSMT